MARESKAERPVPVNHLINLRVRQQGDWFSFECNVCDSIVLSDSLKVVLVTVDELVKRAVVEYAHMGF